MQTKEYRTNMDSFTHKIQLLNEYMLADNCLHSIAVKEIPRNYSWEYKYG